MRNIVVLSRRSVLHPAAGGADRYVHEIFRRLGNRYDVTVISEGPKTAGTCDEVDGVSYVNLRGPFLRFLIPLRYLRRYARNTDVLIDHADVAIPWCSPIMPKTVKITIVHQLVREIFYYEAPRPLSDVGFFAEPLLYRLYSQSSIVTPSMSTARELTEFGIPRENITVVTPACTIPTYVRRPINERQMVIACVSRLVPYKGLQYALRAFRILADELPDSSLKMKIIGSGHFERTLRTIAERLGIQRMVEFLGRVSEERKFEILSECRAAIAPSVREGYGISVLEANSVGTPVVAWDVPGLRDSITDNETGLLAAFPDEREFARHVRTLINEDETWERLSENAWKHARSHSWDRSASQFQDVIERSLAS